MNAWGSSKCPLGGLTACCKQDGFGAQFNAMMSVYAYARKNNKPFCATAWDKMEHGPDGREMFAFVGGDYYGPEADGGAFRMRSAPRPWLQWFSGAMREEFRTAYFRRAKPEVTFFPPEGDSFAWHIRRHDVTSTRHSERFLSNREVVAGVETLKAHHKDMKGIVFFSQGALDDFKDITRHCRSARLNCTFVLDGEVAPTFHHMVMADYLVTSKQSSFSQSAALLGRGTIYQDYRLAEGTCEPFEIWQREPPSHRDLAAGPSSRDSARPNETGRRYWEWEMEESDVDAGEGGG